MKFITICIIFLSTLIPAMGQDLGDDSVLPKVNDVYNSFIDNMPKINLGRQATDQYWDFSSLSSGIVYKQEMLSPDPLLVFSNIPYDFFTKDADDIIRLFRRVGSELFEVAIQRPHPMNSDLIVFSKYSDPKLVAYAPLTYRSEATDRSTIYYDMPGEQIPQLIKSRLPVTADSLRLKVTSITDFRVDAEGNLVLSYDRFEALRQEVSTRTTKRVEIFTAGKWSEIDDQVLDPSGDFLGIKTSRFYLFYSDEVHLPIVKLAVDTYGNVESAEVKAPEIMDNYVPANANIRQLILSPNPTYGAVKLELMNLQTGTYDFEVFNIIGKKLWEDKIQVDRSMFSSKYNFSFLGKGTYLWAITDATGVRVTTKRLVIVTP